MIIRDHEKLEKGFETKTKMAADTHTMFEPVNLHGHKEVCGKHQGFAVYV